MNSADLNALFRDPPAAYRPMMQWSWNGTMTRDRIREQLAQFAEQRCGGVFIYPRPGYEQAYLSKEWFELFGYALDQCKQLGLQCHIYDEFTCPSGFAGGHVVARRPHVAAQVLKAERIEHPWQTRSGTLLRTYGLDGQGQPVEQPERSVRQATPDTPIIALSLALLPPRSRAFAMPDLSLREATDAFIECTYEPYAESAGSEFGQTCKFVFSDEPQLQARGGLTLSRPLLKEFHREHGYDLLDHLGPLCFSQADSPAVRFDYYSTLNRLFVDNYIKPLDQWCTDHALQFTGHLIENWPMPTAQPSPMWALRHMTAPGTDMLGFQFHPTTPAENARWLLIQQLLRPMARQLGRQWLMCESCGANGYGYDVAQFKPLEDFLLALGVRMLDPHLTHQTLVGSRKYEWPQTLSDHSPWWPYYHQQSDHTARVNAMLCQGQDQARVLLMLPTTSGWIHFQHPAFDLGKDNPGEAEMELLESRQQELMLAFMAGQVDFDFGCEFILDELAESRDGVLHVAQAAYDVVVIPDTMDNYTAGSIRWLREYLQAGGVVHALGEPGAYVNGRPSDEPKQLAERFGTQWRQFQSVDELAEATRTRVPPPITAPDGSALPERLMWRRVALEDGRAFYFLCNPWDGPIDCRIRLQGRSVEQYDTATGDAELLAVEQTGDHLVTDLHLTQWGHALWLVSPEPAKQATEPAPPMQNPVEADVRFIEAERTNDNLLVIDYCDIEANGRAISNVPTIHADTANYQWQGFEGTPWRSTNFRGSVRDTPTDPDSSLLIRYRFDLNPNLPTEARQTLRLAIERPWLYTIELNGQPIAHDLGERWFDENVRAFAIGSQVRDGENILTCIAQPFSVFCEIMPAILIGDFAAEPAKRGFEIHPARPMAMGSWQDQGMSFYHDRVAYRFGLDAADPADRIAVHLPDWAGALAEVHVDGESLGTILHPPHRLTTACPLAAGSHELQIDVIGNMKNFMGPHFSDGLPGPWSWSDCPAHQPPGEKYRFYPTGLMSPPQVELA